MDRSTYFKVCKFCGANLDSGEHCACKRKAPDSGGYQALSNREQQRHSITENRLSQDSKTKKGFTINDLV